MLYAGFAEATDWSHLIILQGVQYVLLVLLRVSLSLCAALDVISKAFNEFAQMLPCDIRRDRHLVHLRLRTFDLVLPSGLSLSIPHRPFNLLNAIIAGFSDDQFFLGVWLKVVSQVVSLRCY
jgi:hypothetical protein